MCHCVAMSLILQGCGGKSAVDVSKEMPEATSEEALMDKPEVTLEEISEEVDKELAAEDEESEKDYLPPPIPTG